MPQGRRKVPFSGKAKKIQLQAKRDRKGLPILTASETLNNERLPAILKLNAQSSQTNKSKSNRYALQFYRETEDEIRQKKEEARSTLTAIDEKALEINIDDFFTKELEFPKRPPWNYEMSRQQLELQEQKYFHEYVTNLDKRYHHELSYFELNLETWRQFWRVLEMSDIILVIVDIRFPALMFPSALYDYVSNTLKKDIILVLNKIDLASPSLVVAWKQYFLEKFPNLHVVMFTSFPGYNLRGNPKKKSGLLVHRQKGRLRMAAEGALKLLEVCEEIVKGEVDLSSWHKKVVEEMKEEYEGEGPEVQETIKMDKMDTSFIEHEKFRDGILTIGCIGHPNVGKSSLLNAVMGKKVVSVSRTPGHTKHFQTIFLTPEVRLCDCPGLVFPSKVPRTLQVLMGSFPIAQLREPYSCIKFIAERIDLIRLLSLQHPENNDEWCAMDICEAWAKKRGYFTARTARLDTYRAANHLLRMSLQGKFCVCLRPPNFFENKDYWRSHKDIEVVTWLQASVETDDSQHPREVDFASDDTEEEEGEDDTNVATCSYVADENTDRESDTTDSDDDMKSSVLVSQMNKFSLLCSKE